MRLSQLLSIFGELNLGNEPTREVAGVSQDSRCLESGTVFVAVRGFSADGHEFIQDAVDKGASALVVEDKSKVPEGYNGAVVEVSDTRHALNRLASRFYGHPAEQLFCVGVTGTNGKTSVTYMLECLLTRFGWKTGVLGTVDHHIGETSWQTDLTTPDAVTLHRRLSEMRSLGAEAAAFEVSSIALDQQRADYIPFDVAVFTNLTRDHLDYHRNIENYFLCKQKLFNEVLARSTKPQLTAIINRDDPFGKRMHIVEKARVWGYGQSESEFKFSILNQSFSGSTFSLRSPRGEAEVFVPLPGKHNIYNATATIAAAMAAGMSLEKACESMAHLEVIPGRMEHVEVKGKNVFIDYAHTPDALSSVLHSLQQVRLETASQARIICVFGCGGDRDKGKRPLMMKAAEAHSDIVVLTSDNPRTEDPEAIIQDCLQEVPGEWLNKHVFVNADRRSAIELSLELASPGDVIVVAGKGHENYQIIGKQKVHFSDLEVVKELA